MATTNAAEELKKSKEAYRANTHLNVDIRLSTILDLTFNEDDSHKEGRISLTVVADGAVISGSVVSEDVWAENQAKAMETNSEGFANALRMLQDAAIEGRKTRNAEVEKTGEHRAFRTKIHFEKATVITGGTNIVTTGLRVDLKHVSAWTLGEMAAQN